MRGETGRRRRAYLVRCWWEEAAEDEACAWHFSVEEIGPQRRQRGFSSLEAFIAYWRTELANRPSQAFSSEEERG